ncbi:hypothetical protein CLOACE_22430 [Clostridium acetireducens DSM 10703]|jgi:uncharacterized membrane-anchored protein YitT (DUF2179 family)|uniref:DUF2179 domain-containing protein n=1 Tax=Clostridium acetireducens DSM 10703 TaxID=1121290 RepID=A0A1E8EW19_9CLOT|nr:YitT family protein [Clostridium acetireducens]OFH99453.1 hypothetical protein CLOACE_22430 [Clostridium acetireducens DSM 10703]
MNKTLKDYALLLLGSILFSVYTCVFLIPAEIGTGGITGIALCLNKLFGFKIGFLTIVLNIPLFIFGYKLIGRKFAFRSGLVVIISSIIIDYSHEFVKIQPLGDTLLSAIFCGVTSGIAMSLLFVSGGSTGGLDISGKIINHSFKSLELPKILLAQDILVYTLVAFVFGPKAIMYTLIMSFIRSKTMDAFQRGFASSMQCIIICENSELIMNAIKSKLLRGATILDAMGGYSSTNKKFIYVVIQKNQLGLLRKLVSEIEPHAFVAISPVNNILGNYKNFALSFYQN